MNIWIAGRDKPHRCPDCWRVRTYDKVRFWRIRKFLPRTCPYCGALALTTFPRRADGWEFGSPNE